MKIRIHRDELLCLKIGGAIACGLWLMAGNAGAQTNLFTNVGIEQKLNAQVPLDLTFRDETGAAIGLNKFFDRKPVILVLAYYECPNLCTLVLNALLASAQDLKLDAGKDFEIVVISINPLETPALAAEKKRTYVKRYGRAGGDRGWHFLTGEEAAIEHLSDSVGFRYALDPQTKQYAHTSAIIVLTPQGRVSRYFAGIEYPPKELRLALAGASDQHIGSATDQLFLFCFHYNPLTGKYGLAIMNVVRAVCCLTVIVLGTFVSIQLHRDRGRHSHVIRSFSK